MVSSERLIENTWRLNKKSLILQSQEVEETLKRISQYKGVVGTIVVNNEGIYQ